MNCSRNQYQNDRELPAGLPESTDGRRESRTIIGACLRSIWLDVERYQDSLHLRKIAYRQYNSVFKLTHNTNVAIGLHF